MAVAQVVTLGFGPGASGTTSIPTLGFTPGVVTNEPGRAVAVIGAMVRGVVGVGAMPRAVTREG